MSTWRGKNFSDMTDDEIREMCAPRQEHPVSDEYPDLPEDRYDRAAIAEAAERNEHLAYNRHTDRHETGGDEVEFADESE